MERKYIGIGIAVGILVGLFGIYLFSSGNPTASADSDNDGIKNSREKELGTDPHDPDTDGDGINDKKELELGTGPVNFDTDSDGLGDGKEVNELGTDPKDKNTDDDGLEDGPEINTYGTNPKKADTDGDGLDDGEEVDDYQTNPSMSDTDGDGLEDGPEVNGWTIEYTTVNSSETVTRNVESDPLEKDSNSDGLTDVEEKNKGTHPQKKDTDGDRYTDFEELNNYGSDPSAPTFPDLKVRTDVSYKWSDKSSTFIVTVDYTIKNVGKVPTTDVEMNMHGEEKEISQRLGPNETLNDSLSTMLERSNSDDFVWKHGGTNELDITVEEKFSSVSVSKNVRFRLNWDNLTYLVTPDDPLVESLVGNLLSDRSWWDIRGEYKVLRDYVGSEITYVWDDEDTEDARGQPVGDGHPGSDYWQLSRETIRKKEGDCEDQAILLCSMLREAGYENAYVILGKHHAWVELRVQGETILGNTVEISIYLEPTAGGIVTGELTDLISTIQRELGMKPEECWKFNDKTIKKFSPD